MNYFSLIPTHSMILSLVIIFITKPGHNCRSIPDKFNKTVIRTVKPNSQAILTTKIMVFVHMIGNLYN